MKYKCRRYACSYFATYSCKLSSKGIIKVNICEGDNKTNTCKLNFDDSFLLSKMLLNGEETIHRNLKLEGVCKL